MKNNVRKALLAHQSGDLKEAEALYRECILITPNDSNGWYLYGALCQQVGKNDLARKYLDHSIKLNSRVPEALNIRGILHKENGQVADAERDFRAALSLDANFPEALTNLADTCRLTGNYAEATRLNNQAIRLSPSLATAHNNCGVIEKELGNLKKAKKAFGRAIELDANLINATVNLILILRMQGKTKVALERATDIIQKAPRYAPAHNCLGLVYLDLNRNREAKNSFKRACANGPKYADSHNNLGITLTRLGQLTEAHRYFDLALKLEPENAGFWSNKAASFQADNRIEEALKACKTALKAEPNHADARWNRGIARLVSGNLRGGFADYEARWLLPEFKHRAFNSQLWQNEDLSGKSILIYSEQGFGDTVQFIRYVALLAEENPESIYLETDKPLVSLLRKMKKIDRVFNKGDILPISDYHVPLMSLAHRFKTTQQNIPTKTPYLKVTANSPYIFKKDPVKQKKLKIGLVWAGRKSHKNDKNRSISLDLCTPFLEGPNNQLYSLQCGGARECKKYLNNILDLSDYLTDFAATGAILKNLDLVITVDTALGHLAGALGVKCWIMLPFAPDWRWQLGKHTSPWYASIELFRQQEPNNWETVISEITLKLAELHNALHK